MVRKVGSELPQGQPRRLRWRAKPPFLAFLWRKTMPETKKRWLEEQEEGPKRGRKSPSARQSRVNRSLLNRLSSHHQRRHPLNGLKCHLHGQRRRSTDGTPGLALLRDEHLHVQRRRRSDGTCSLARCLQGERRASALSHVPPARRPRWSFACPRSPRFSPLRLQAPAMVASTRPARVNYGCNRHGKHLQPQRIA